jgi:sialidase-1
MKLFFFSRACLWFAAVATLSVPLVESAQAVPTYDPDKLPKGHEYFDLRDGIQNARARFETEKKGRVAFLGGSITAAAGWRDPLMKWLQKRFPETEFEFIGAGIGSLGSVPHAFRLEQDVLSKGSVDLLFVEAAVNDGSNIPEQPVRMLRGMEGVVRHAREVNPRTDIVHMHFAMPDFLAEYRKGTVPQVIAQHEKVAVAYGNPSVNLALEVTERIDTGEFSWQEDFKGLHPSPFGNQLYAHSISRMLDAAWSGPVQKPKDHSLPAALLDPQSYSQGRFGNLQSVRLIKGFERVENWSPTVKAGTRPGFVNVPALVATEPEAELEIPFQGRGIGVFIGAGPDAGQLEVSCDGGAFRKVETFTHWSSGLYLPWALMLEDEVPPGPHTVRVKISKEHHEKSKGTALYILRVLEN